MHKKSFRLFLLKFLLIFFIYTLTPSYLQARTVDTTGHQVYLSWLQLQNQLRHSKLSDSIPSNLNPFEEQIDSATYRNNLISENDPILDLLRWSPVEDFFMDWDTATVDPYNFDLKELTYDFPLCLFIDPNETHSLPLKSLYKTSSFGPRWGRHHKGIDFDVNIGDSVFNMFDGMVRISTYSSSFGHFVVVRHFNGLETLYAHLSGRNVVPGDIIKSGDCIGLGGNTGRSTGPHLHFEVRYKGVAFDPENLLDVQAQCIVNDELTIDSKLFNYLNYKKSRKPVASSNAKYYTIKSGDTLGVIARRHGTTVSNLCSLNGLKPSSTLRIGKTLRVK